MLELNGYLRRRVLWCAVVLALPLPALADSGVATVSAEATVYEDNVGANGGGYLNICVGNLGVVGSTRRASVRFNLPAIPPGSVVTRVEYVFTQIRVRFRPDGRKPANLELRRVTESWVEGTGTLLGEPCGGGANVAGVDWASAPAVQKVASAAEFLPATDDTPITIDTDIGIDDDGLIADVQAWVDDPAGNFGWEYRVAEEDTLDNARLLSPGSITIHWQSPPLNFEDGFENQAPP